MKIAIWKTGHEIADRVAGAIKEGLPNAKIFHASESGHDKRDDIFREYDIHIAYGILRGCEEISRRADKFGKTWFNVDRGYFNPGHFDGYYRISLGGTQHTTNLDKIIPDYKRLEQLRIKCSQPTSLNYNAHTLIVPPTEHVAKFFGYDSHKWMTEIYEQFGDIKYIIRRKSEHIPLDEQLANCLRVVTFNSSIGWEALRRRIPVYSDVTHSIVGAYQKSTLQSLHLDVNETYKLFATMCSLQLTLSEIKDGKLCSLMNNLILSLATMQENQLQHMWQPIASENGPTHR